MRSSNIRIGAGLGQQHGGNLFHSFRKFDIEKNAKVTFTGPGSVRNVISRVTGGQHSSIDGTLASDIEGADVYIINPAGILFGPNAQLEIKGAFHASTADQLHFATGEVFSALDAAGSTLSVAEPQAFGFLGRNIGHIKVEGNVDDDVISNAAAVSLTSGAIEVTVETSILLNSASSSIQF